MMDAWHGMAWHGMAWHGMAWHGRAGAAVSLVLYVVVTCMALA